MKTPCDLRTCDGARVRAYLGDMSSQSPGTRLEETPAVFRYPGKDDSPVTVMLRRRNRRDRFVMVAKTWAIAWLAAIAAVFLPVLHFILVPSLLIGGPIYAIAQFQEHTTLMGGGGPCPACGAEVKLTQKRRAEARIAVRCESCGRRIELGIAPEKLEAEAA